MANYCVGLQIRKIDARHGEGFISFPVQGKANTKHNRQSRRNCDNHPRRFFEIQYVLNPCLYAALTKSQGAAANIAPLGCQRPAESIFYITAALTGNLFVTGKHNRYICVLVFKYTLVA